MFPFLSTKNQQPTTGLSGREGEGERGEGRVSECHLCSLVPYLADQPARDPAKKSSVDSHQLDL